jgi:hypothetical protein
MCSSSSGERSDAAPHGMCTASLLARVTLRLHRTIRTPPFHSHLEKSLVDRIRSYQHASHRSARHWCRGDKRLASLRRAGSSVQADRSGTELHLHDRTTPRDTWCTQCLHYSCRGGRLRMLLRRRASASPHRRRAFRPDTSAPHHSNEDSTHRARRGPGRQRRRRRRDRLGTKSVHVSQQGTHAASRHLRRSRIRPPRRGTTRNPRHLSHHPSHGEYPRDTDVVRAWKSSARLRNPVFAPDSNAPEDRARMISRCDTIPRRTRAPCSTQNSSTCHSQSANRGTPATTQSRCSACRRTSNPVHHRYSRMILVRSRLFRSPRP